MSKNMDKLIFTANSRENFNWVNAFSALIFKTIDGNPYGRCKGCSVLGVMNTIYRPDVAVLKETIVIHSAISWVRLNKG